VLVEGVPPSATYKLTHYQQRHCLDNSSIQWETCSFSPPAGSLVAHHFPLRR